MYTFISVNNLIDIENCILFGRGKGGRFDHGVDSSIVFYFPLVWIYREMFTSIVGNEIFSV